MTKSQLELALREAAKIARERDFIIFGSQCILGISHGLIRSRILKERVGTLPVTPSALQEIQAILRAIRSKGRKPPLKSRRS